METRRSLSRPAALSLCLAIQILGSNAFLVPRHSALKAAPVFQMNQRRIGGIRMLKEPQGSDAFTRIVEEHGKGLSALHKLQAGPAKAIKFTSIPIGAAIGFVGTPVASPVVRAAGAFIAGTAAKFANDRIRSMRETGAEVALAQLLLDYGDDLASLTPHAVKSVTAQYDVEYATHLSIVTKMYTNYLLAMLEWPDVRMQEPASLIELSSALGLDSTSIGDAHCVVAEEIAKRLAEVPMDEQEDAWEQKMVNKLLFLSNRVFTQLDEEETREYELSRLEEILGLSASEGSDRIQGLVLPFYAGIVRSGIEHIRSGKGQALDADKLAQWRKSLGIKDPVAAKLHSEAFSSEVTKAVEAGKGRLREESMNFLERAKDLMSLAGFSADRTLEAVTSPLLRKSIMTMLTTVTTNPDRDAWPEALAQVRQRQKELRLVDSALVFQIKDVYRQRIRRLLRESMELIDVAVEANESVSDKVARQVKLRNMLSAVLLQRKLMAEFVEVNELGELMDEDLSHIDFLSLLPAELDPPQREVLFRRYVQALVNAQLVSEEGSSINDLGEYFEIEPPVIQAIVKSIVGPIYEAKVKAFVEKNELTSENKQELMSIIKDFRVGDAEVRAIGVSLYKAKAESLFGEKKQFSDAELASLATLKGFLLLSEADVDRVHEPMAKEDFLRVVDEEFSKQAKAAAEGGAAPAMSESARQRIHDTAKRLGLSEDARDDLLGIALTRTLDPQLESLKTQYRRVTMTAEEKKESGGKDEGEDPFIRARTKEGLMIKTERNSNLMVDAVNLVKFLEDNDGFRDTMLRLDDESHMIKPADPRPKRMVTQYICKAVTKAFSRDDDSNAKLAEEIYKAFVQTVARAPEGEKKDRYRVVQDKFGAVLGMHPPRMESIKFDMYAEGMKKLVKGCLEAKGMLGPDDVAELAKLNKDFAVSEDRAERLVQAEKRKWLVGNVLSIISSPPNIPGPTVQKLRLAAASMGVDLSEDMQELTEGNREWLFRQELRWLLETHTEDADGETVADLMEQFGVDEKRAEDIIQYEFKEATRQVAVDLIGQMNRDAPMTAFRDLGKLIRIGNMVPMSLDFGAEAFLGMAVCADMLMLWKSYATLLRDGPEAVKPVVHAYGTTRRNGLADLSAVTDGVSDDDLAQLKAQFEDDDEIVKRLVKNLNALPATAADVIDLDVNYRGVKVKRKKAKPEQMADTPEEWQKGEVEIKVRRTDGVVVNYSTGEEMTPGDVVKKALETRAMYLNRRKRKSSVATKNEDGPPRSASGRRAA